MTPDGPKCEKRFTEADLVSSGNAIIEKWRKKVEKAHAEGFREGMGKAVEISESCPFEFWSVATGGVVKSWIVESIRSELSRREKEGE